MRKGSLRLRLLVAAAISIATALTLTGIAIVRLFEKQVRERVLVSLDNDLLQLVSIVEVQPDGTVTAKLSLSDPRFQEPYGGRYWRIDFAAPGAGNAPEPLRSQYLWDADIDPANPTSGPEGEKLIATARQVTVQRDGKPLPLWITVATHAEEVTRPIEELRDQLVLSFTLIGIILTLGAWVQVSVGLRPLQHLRRELADVRAGLAQRLTGDVPTEVAPLVEEFNDVLTLRETSLERARRRAGDLAHGLKTPLTVLTAIARDVRSKKLTKQADEIDEQADAMHRHVEQALVRARLSTGRSHASAALRPAVEKMIAALERLPGGDELDWELHVASGTAVPIEQGDLTELLGNLLDNARKWAKTRVKITFTAPHLIIEDDGPGVPDAELSHIAERGRRLDESKQGSGLGLSIVEDIADIYGLAVDYDRSDLGGLRVTIRV